MQKRTNRRKMGTNFHTKNLTKKSSTRNAQNALVSHFNTNNDNLYPYHIKWLIWGLFEPELQLNNNTRKA